MILIIGNKGSMGQRYSAILKYLDLPFKGIDVNEEWPDFDKAIVATPTNTHFNICNVLINMKKNFLCEKPVSKYSEECRVIRDKCLANGIDGRMVCNWSKLDFISGPNKNVVSYNNFNTGKDGLHWDCIQLHYLAINRAHITTDRPFFSASINGMNYTLGDIEYSYIKMIQAWIINRKELWDMQNAVEATEKVKGIIEDEETK